jgi:malate dehydrogenase
VDRIVILGAGELGGLLAHALARRGVARDVCLIDEGGRAAEGKALDIMQAAPVEGFSATVSGSPDPSLAGGATAVVIADAFGGGEWHGESALALLTRVCDFAPKALVLCAGASQRELIDRGVRELHIQRSRLIGSAPEALVSGARAVVAAELTMSPSDVALTALGVPPDHLVIPWEDATAGGFSLHRIVNEPTRRRLETDVARLWPPGPYALASAAAKVLDTWLGRSTRRVTCFVAADDSTGQRARTSALPVRLNRTGPIEVVLPELSGRDRVRLDNAMLL